MRRLKFLLRPGWVVLALVVAGFAFLCFTVLAPWQLGKNTSTEHRNQQIADSVDADPVAVESLFDDGVAEENSEWRRVNATGSYLPNSDVLVRLRAIDSQPAYEVLTPFRLDDGATVLVNRGYVRPVQGTEAPPIDPAPTGQQTLDGRIRNSEGTVAGKEPFEEDGRKQVYFIDTGQVAALTGTDLLDAYVQLEPDQPGGLGTIPLPQLDAGPYLSYGLQWLAFGIMAPLGLAYFVRAEWLERRKEKAAASSAPKPGDDAASAHGAGAPTTRTEPSATESSAADSATTLTATQAKLADRYGKRR
ncbi:SURF1 family protein [Rhodococcus sp. NPDC058521]|uniref:SURF1 family cytochrome oxidase biogenesis protein n=1 Tax=Rhodococcus sp. NPDC058521 TaxID=3346536 RepID=UPI003669CDEB